ncbi:anti-sigma factor antagonist [Streptomyces sp. NRRL B-1677]|nr:anti-sigma factor antagonist [Streptomyces sp. NRRL B-1677]
MEALARAFPGRFRLISSISVGRWLPAGGDARGRRRFEIAALDLGGDGRRKRVFRAVHAIRAGGSSVVESEYGARIRVKGRWAVLELAGELDIAAVPAVEELLLQLVAPGAPVVVIDLREVTFFDCSVLGALYRARAGVLASGGCFAVLCVRPWALKIMHMAELLDVFRPVAALVDLADLDSLDNGRRRDARA